MNGIWTAGDAEHHQTSEKLAITIARLMATSGCKSFCDFGCGNGYYVDFLVNKGWAGIGIDGNEAGVKYKTNVFIEDLTLAINLKHDCSISLEVAEHLPKSAQETFMKNVCDSARKLLILSWAELGQPGIGHVNCRSQEDVIADVCSRGFELDLLETKQARSNIDANCSWFERTLLIFKRK
jgi:cyclopropane fatty-acyl-phospholipid synthase-like methyltransferase